MMVAADKVMHFCGVALIAALAYVMTGHATGALIAALGVGLIKELVDSRAGGSGFSWGDMVADALGAAAGVAAVRVGLGPVLGYALVGAYTTWIFYLAVMALIRARDAGTLSPVALGLAYPVVAVGLVLDFTLHAVVGTAVFLEPPREWLLTQRLSRLIRTDMGWRGDLAAWVCAHLLNAFDPDGRHCAERAA